MLDPNRFRGCLLGLACGDAVGATVEFSPRGSFTPVTDMVGGGPYELQPGEWTDDTSMALCLATSLIELQRFDPLDQMLRYCRWRDQGCLSSNGRCFDIGATVARALRSFNQTGEPFSGPLEPRTAGNGSIMRLAPVPMAYSRDPIRAVAMAAQSSRTTHGAPAAVDACRYLAAMIVAALTGASKEELLASSYFAVPGAPLVPEISAIAAGSFKLAEPPVIAGTGYVVKSLEAALWAFHKGSSFRECVLLAANLGDDADTTAAICGQLAGAHYGMSGIPAGWLESLALRDHIISLADQLQAWEERP
jgi:ADP-ribosylglycohydrolase